MKLDEYLKGLRECQDEYVEVDGRTIPMLTAEFGIYDNFSVILQVGDYNSWIENLKRNYNYLGSNKSLDAERFIHSENPTTFYTIPDAEIALHISVFDRNKRIRGGIEIYNTSLIINTPYRWNPQDSEELRKRRFLESHRQISNLVIDLSNLLKNSKIPFSFLKSMGWNHQEDYSKIVTYKPLRSS